MILSLTYGRFIQDTNCNDGRVFGLWVLAFVELMGELIFALSFVSL